MTHWRNHIVAALCLLACASLLPTETATAAKPKRLHPELDEDFIDFAAGKTLAQLRTNAKPTLVGDEKNPDATWVWITRTSLGTPVFTLATPYKTPRGTYAILDANSSFTYYDQPYFRERIVKIMSKIPAQPSGTYAAMAGTHPVHGTLFQLGYHFNVGCCGSREIRVFLLHGRDGTWRFVGECPGNWLDDSESCTTVTSKITWTDDPKAPVHITLQDRFSGLGDFERCYEKTLSGPLPAFPQARETAYIIVPKGATFSGICAALAPPHGVAYNDPVVKNYRAALLKLNPGLNPDQIKAGQKLFLPLPDKSPKIIRSAKEFCYPFGPAC